MSRISAKVILVGRSGIALIIPPISVNVALERQNKIDNGSAEGRRNGPHRRIEPVLGGLGFK